MSLTFFNNPFLKVCALTVPLLATIVLGGCSTFTRSSDSDAVIQPADDEKVIAAVQQLLATTEVTTDKQGLTQFNGLQYGVSLYDYADTIAMRLYEQFVPSAGVAVTSFVNFDATLRRTHPLGNQLAEVLKTSLTQMGYAVVEVNLAEQIEITDKGNFMLSRDAGSSSFEFVVVGSIIHRDRGLVINTRLVEAATRKTYAATNLTIPAYLFM